MKRTLQFLLPLLPAAAMAVPHVEETLRLEAGWNAVYVESTPDNPRCEDFFAGTPVVGAAAYVSAAAAETAQFDSSGREILQAPVSFLQWVPGESVSTLQSISGGSTFLLYAEEATNIVFLGVPAPPKITWHKVSSAETNALLNLAGVSSASNGVPLQKYFGEGPFGSSTVGRAVRSIGGDDPARPELKDEGSGSFGRPATLVAGRAYALTATTAGDWPGVIGVQGASVIFGADANYATIKVKNCGTAAREFRFTMEESATHELPPPVSRRLPRVDALGDPGYTNVVENLSWTVSIEPGEVVEQIFSLDRSRLVPGEEHGAILAIEDLGGSLMRVRVPIVVAGASERAVAYPAGLWVGEIALSKVSGIDDATPTPVEAGGTLRMNVMVHVGTNGACRLLQRVAAGVDTNGTARLFTDLEDVPAEVEDARRISTVMMSVDTPVVEAEDGSAFGTNAVFSWTIAPTARDNPFRHAWHPDHDGKTSDYEGPAPSGDDFGNYAQPVKPELWSISNRLDVSWRENGDPALPAIFPYNADETTSGAVTWEVTGLTAKGPIKSTGTFQLRRVFNAAELE